MPLINRFNSWHTEDDAPMTVAELAQCLRGVENRNFPSDDPDVEWRDYWRNANVEVLVEGAEGKTEWYDIVGVGYACTSPEPMIRLKKSES